MPPLMILRYFAEAVQSWVLGAPRATGARGDAMSEKRVLIDVVDNAEYRVAVSKYLYR